MSSAPGFDLYEVLEVPKTADQKEIKDAYRRLALKYRPDKNQDNPAATAQFQMLAQTSDLVLKVESVSFKPTPVCWQINRAYETLSDPSSKARYDSPLSSASSTSQYHYDYDSEDGYFSFQSFNGPFEFFLGGGGFGGFTFSGGNARGGAFGGSRDFLYGARNFREYTRLQKEAREQDEREYQQRQVRLAEARAQQAAKEAIEKAKREAKDVEEKTARELKKLKACQDRDRQYKIWEEAGVTTMDEKQVSCHHASFWPEEQQKKKFKCMECNMKRGMTAYNCPWCAFSICQGCLIKRNGDDVPGSSAACKGLKQKGRRK